MANPTTNYGFVLPTPTDLVTDLPADFDVALQGVDTRLKALQPGTTLGDLAYSSATANTNTRLGIGSTGQVLAVSGGVPAWTTPASGATVLVNRTTFSNVASQTFSNVFSSTYKAYTIIYEKFSAGTAGDDCQFIFMYGATESANHYGMVNYYTLASSTLQQNSVSNGTSFVLSADSGTSNEPVTYNLTVGNIGSGAANAMMHGTGYSLNGSHSLWFGGYSYSLQTYTGFKVKSSSSNVTGTISVYGWKDA